MFFKNLVKKQADRLTKRHGAVVFMPMKTGDVEVVESFAKPLRQHLLATGLGDVTGYTLRPGRFDEPSGIEICLQLASAHPRALQSVAKILTLLSLLIPAFSLLSRPHLLTMMLQPTTVRSPTTHVKNINP